MSGSNSILFRVIKFGHHIYSFAKDDQKVFAEMHLLDDWQGHEELFYINIKTTVYNRTFDTMLRASRSDTMLDKYHGDKELQIKINMLCHYLQQDTKINPKEMSLIFQAWEGFFE